MMTEDLLDSWVRHISPIFPDNAWIVSSYSGDNHIIQVDWKLRNDPKQPGKRSRKIEITIKEDAIDDYLDKSEHDRELYVITLKKLICEWYNRFNPDDNSLATRSATTEKWLISREVLNNL